uniref:Hypermethylated in cancer 1 protein n=1 Tax=Paramormyrops kingsleyae TaxID=1676925 RepID=A0A3B3TF05_9TELE|nr:hypermethylated in cancer 2 protein-like [Paramormyrops kingsleyae]
MELPNHARQLLLQLNQQRAKGFLCDVIIVVENALFRAHKNVLAASSMYFKSLMLHDNLVNLDMDMVSPSVFRQVLDFIYTGKLPSTDQPCQQKFTALLTAASYLQLHDLAALCRKRLKGCGKPLPVKPGMVRGHRKQKVSSAKPASVHRLVSEDKQRDQDKPQDERVSEDEEYAGRAPGTTSGSKTGSSGEVGGGDEEEDGQEVGLDLSKKSPSESSVTEEVSPPSLRDESPPSESPSAGNSATSEEPGQPPDLEDGEPMELGERALEKSPLLPDGDRPRARFRQSARKKEWPKREGGVANATEKPAAANLRSVVTGDQPSNGNSFSSDQAFGSAEEGENGKDHSDESEGESPGANYVYRQEGFEVAVGDNLYVCIPCGKGFPSSERLNAHVETHTEEELCIKEEAEDLSARVAPPPGTEPRPFECSVCSKSYKDPASLRQHEKGHWLPRPFPCHICGKMFTQRGTMTRHMRSHLGLKPFACEECGMRFTRQYRLTEHMRVHSGEKPYECQLCGGKFTQQRNLISHLRMHTSPA